MGVRDRLPEETLARELREQSRTAAELKAAQTRGSSSVLTYRTFTQDVFDVQLNGIGSFTQHRVDVEFIPDDLTFGGAFCHRLEVKAMTTANVIIRTPITIQRRPSVDGRQQWSIFMLTFGGASDSRRLKFYLFSTGSGTIQFNVVH